MDSERFKFWILRIQAMDLGITGADMKSLLASYNLDRNVDEEDFKKKFLFPLVQRLKTEKERANPSSTSAEPPQDQKLNQEALDIRKAMGRPRRANTAQKPLASDGKGQPSGSTGMPGSAVPKPQDTAQSSAKQETKDTAQAPLSNTDKEKADYEAAYERAKATNLAAFNVVKNNPGPNASKAGATFVNDFRAMHADATNNRYGDALKKLGTVEPLARQVLAAKANDDLAAQTPLSNADKEKADYETAYAKAKATNLAAFNVVKNNPGPNASKAGATFVNDFRAMHTDATNNRYGDALKKLGTVEPLARQVLAAKRLDGAAAQKEKQLAVQKAQFDAMAPTMMDVKRSYLPEGAADHIGENHKGKEAEFKSFLAALKQLEASKKGIDPKTPVPKQQAMAIQELCESVIVAAQKYLALDPKSGKPDEIARKEEICEEHIKIASQYRIAMVLDAAGKPDAKNPWDLETQARAMGALAAFSYEQGYQKATGLDGDKKGGSDSFWIKHKDIDAKGAQVTNKRGDFIFKPMEGEENPTGMKSKKGAGSIKEALASSNANLFAAQTGIELGVPTTTVVSVGSFAVEGKKPSDPPLIGSVQQHAGASTMIKDLPKDMLAKVKREDIHKIALLDIMSLTMDRHHGNIMVNTDDPDNPGLVPIDHGGSLPSRKDWATAKKRMGGVSPQDGAPPENVVVNTLLRHASSYEKFDEETVAKLELLDPAAMEKGMKDQRDALGKVHPGLDPADKVGDDSFLMAKRAMMFLKRAAKTLSPAEIQIALAAHGESLFDAPDDNAFNQLADQVIAEQVPKKEAYQEIMTMENDELMRVTNWLMSNNWGLQTEHGRSFSEEFLMRDPVNALKLYKAQKKNPTTIKVPAPINAPNPNSAKNKTTPDQSVQSEIQNAFPGSRDLKDLDKKDLEKEWQKRGFYWTEINNVVVDGKKGMAAYQTACDTIGVESTTSSMETALRDLLAWQELKTKDSPAILADILQHKTTGVTVAFTRTAALNRDAANKQLAAANSTGADIDADIAIRDYTQRLFDETKAITKALYDRTKAGAFDKRADEAYAKRATDISVAQADLQSLWAESNGFLPLDLGNEMVKLIDRLEKIVPTIELPTESAYKDGDQTKYMEELAQYKKGVVAKSYDITLLNILMKQLDGHLTELAKVKPTKAAVTPAPTISADTTATQPAPTNPAPDSTTATTATQPPPRPTQDPPVPISAFAWSQSASSASKKEAVKAKLFKDKDTGMTSALEKVLEARKKIEGMKPTLANDKKISTLEKAIEEYNKFGIFVASKLRGLSGNAGWQTYCNEAVREMQNEIGLLRADIAKIPKT